MLITISLNKFLGAIQWVDNPLTLGHPERLLERNTLLRTRLEYRCKAACKPARITLCAARSAGRHWTIIPCFCSNTQIRHVDKMSRITSARIGHYFLKSLKNCVMFTKCPAYSLKYDKQNRVQTIFFRGGNVNQEKQSAPQARSFRLRGFGRTFL